jgi:hypothetical protein
MGAARPNLKAPFFLLVAESDVHLRVQLTVALLVLFPVGKQIRNNPPQIASCAVSASHAQSPQKCGIHVLGRADIGVPQDFLSNAN